MSSGFISAVRDTIQAYVEKPEANYPDYYFGYKSNLDLFLRVYEADGANKYKYCRLCGRSFERTYQYGLQQSTVL